MALYPKFGEVLRVDFQSIAFVCGTDDPDLLQRIHLAEQNYDTARGALDIRNQMKQEVFATANVVDFDAQTGASRINAAHSDIFMLKQSTDRLYECVDGALPILEQGVKDTEGFVKGNFQKRKALIMAPKE